MSITIDDDLKLFKSNVSPSISTMINTCTDIINKITSLKGANDNAISGINSFYQSENKSQIISDLNSINEAYTEILNSVGDKLTGMLSKSSELITSIEKLETLKSEIEAKESALSSEKNKAEPNTGTINSISSVISAKTSEFNSALSLAKSKLAEIKAMDGVIELLSEKTHSSSSMSADLSEIQSMLKYGTFEKKKYNDPNGASFFYYMYVPDYDKPVSGLPVHMYIGGVGVTGLPLLVQKKQVTPSGIVIFPLFTNSDMYRNPKCEDALHNLTEQVVKEYDADPSRISLSGHSLGAMISLRLIAKFPNYYSAVVPISGHTKLIDGMTGDLSKIASEDIEALKKVKMWAFCGTSDTSWGNYQTSKALVDYLKELGADATMHEYEREGHNVQEKTFTKNYTNENENVTMNPLEWAFRQKKEDA